MTNVERADQVMEKWVPVLQDQGPSPGVFRLFMHLLTKKYEEVLGERDEELFSRRAILVWQDDDWDLCHLTELRDLIAIDLDALEEHSMG